MFATLLLIRHLIDGGREATTLEAGATLADELMRLYPRGFGRPFDLYLRDVRDENLIPAAQHPTHRVIEGERYILQVRPLGLTVLAYFAISMLVSVAVSVVAKALMPKPKQADSNAATEQISPNNTLAGQTNLLRPGARVPEILGRMRCWPDLIANAQESWIARSQWIVEWFVLGVGRYQLDNARLGETAVAGLAGANLFAYPPGTTVPPILCVKRSPLVDNLSLLTETTTASAAQTTFTPPTSMSSTLYVPLSLGSFGTPVRIAGTSYNNGLFDITQVPAQTQTEGPWLYTIEGPVRAEVAADAIVRPAPSILWRASFPLSGNSTGDIFIARAQGWVPVVGQIVRLYASAGQRYIGTVVQVIDDTASTGQYRIRLNNFSGNPIIITATNWAPNLIVYDDEGEIVQALTRATDQMFTVWTDWQTAPFADPQQLLIDIAFPQGLVWYNKGERRSYTVQVQAEFRRLGAAAGQASRTWTYTNSTQGALRYTEAVVVAGLGLPAGSPYLQTRLRRVTAWVPDDNENQYIADTRWQAYAAAVELPAQTYGNVTLLQLTLWNTRAAASIGETSFNVIATRVLPRWSAGGWLPAAPTERWADAFVARMKASDGANKADADIDLAGIYAIQARLDAQDGGDQGRIAMTLDQQQDIDTELQSIASVVRCQLYRIGSRLYVERDEGGKSAIALFTGRSKHPDAETVSINLASDADPDAVIVPWWDRSLDAWKQREYQFPENVTPINPLRIAPPQATWAQAWRRARYEWNRLTLRRETLALKATEEASLVHPGDVINVADDVGNLSQTAGEVLDVQGDTLTLDQEVNLSEGNYVLLLRSLDGRATDTIAVTQSSAAELRLGRPARFIVKGRDAALGSMYALYRADRSIVIPWLVSSIEPEERYINVNAMNWTEAVFAGDAAPLPAPPVVPFISALHQAQPQTIGAIADEDITEGAT